MVRGGRTEGPKGYEGQKCADVLLEASKKSIRGKTWDIHDKCTRRRHGTGLVNVVHWVYFTVKMSQAIVKMRRERFRIQRSERTLCEYLIA